MRLAGTALLILAMFSCGEKEAKDIMPQHEMQRVMWDMMQVDEFVTGYLYNDTAVDLKTSRLKLYKDVFRIHKISEKDFEKSFKYYANHPDLMKQIFDSLSVRGDREKKTLYMPKDSAVTKPPIADSIRKDSVAR